MDDRLCEFLGVVFPAEVHVSSVPRDDASLDDIVADGLTKRSTKSRETAEIVNI